MDLDYKAKLKDSIKHFQTGVAYMLPFLMLGALGKVIPTLFGQGMNPTNPILSAILTAGNVGMDIFIPVMAAYISFAIADTPGIAPGLVIGVVAKAGGSGYIGGLLGGFLAGYMTYTLVGLSRKLPHALKSTWDGIMPSLGGLLLSIVIVLFVNPPVKLLMDSAAAWLGGLTNGSNALLGTIMGGIVGVDFGGPLGQAKFAFALAALDKGLLVPLAITGATASIPAIGMCLATYITPKLFKENMRSYGKTSLLYALIGGWTEIAIPFVVDDWFNVTVSSIVGSAVAGALAGFIQLQVGAPVLGVLGTFLYNKWWGYILCVVIGSLVTALLVALLKSRAQRKHPLEAVEKPA